MDNQTTTPEASTPAMPEAPASTAPTMDAKTASKGKSMMPIIIIGLLIVCCLLSTVAGAAIFFLGKDEDKKDDNGGDTTPTPTEEVTETPEPTVELPTGYTKYDGSYFTIGIPSNFNPTEQSSDIITFLNKNGSGDNVTIAKSAGTKYEVNEDDCEKFADDTEDLLSGSSDYESYVTLDSGTDTISVYDACYLKYRVSIQGNAIIQETFLIEMDNGNASVQVAYLTGSTGVAELMKIAETFMLK